MQVDAEVGHETDRPCSHAEGLGICGHNCYDEVDFAFVRSENNQNHHEVSGGVDVVVPDHGQNRRWDPYRQYHPLALAVVRPFDHGTFFGPIHGNPRIVESRRVSRAMDDF